MVWVKVDDGMPDHPKLQEVGPLGFALDLAGIAYCNRNLTDGFVPMAKAVTLFSWEGLHSDRLQPVDDDEGKRFGRAVADALCGVGRWHLAGVDACGCIPAQDRGEGFWIHDFSGYNPSREKVLSAREADLQRKKNGHGNQQSDKVLRHSKRNPNGFRRDSARIPVLPVPEPVPVRNGEGTGIPVASSHSAPSAGAATALPAPALGPPGAEGEDVRMPNRTVIPPGLGDNPSIREVQKAMGLDSEGRDPKGNFLSKEEFQERRRKLTEQGKAVKR